MSTETRNAIEAVFRIEAAQLIAGLARVTRDLTLAEDLAQDALVAALEQWPRDGTPDNPGAWLMAAAKHRAVDRFRRAQRLERTHRALGSEAPASQTPDLEGALDENVGDDLLRLIFIACHPVIAPEARVALTLRLVGGLATSEIARAFLTPVPTIAQRLVRAKQTLAEARVPFEVPRGEALLERLASVLEVISLIFNEGHSATAGEDWVRPALCDEALRLGRVLAGLLPDEAEVHGLVALMALQASRLPARVTEDGGPVLLLEQNRARWDRVLIGLGLGALERAEALRPARGRYALQAALAACHARALTPEATDWARIVGLYTELAERYPSPVVDLNRAVALGMLLGPEAGLKLVDELSAEGALRGYHLLPAVRADFLAKLGRRAEARDELRRAASLTRNERERLLLLERAEALGQAAGP